MRLFVTSILVSLFALPVGAATYVILPDGTGDFATIQEAVAAVDEGDIIELGDGVFVGPGNRDITLGNTDVTIRSQSGNPESCIIDCESGAGQDAHRAFFSDVGADGSLLLHSVSIRNGHASDGGAIWLNGAGFQLENCHLSGCSAENSGGALYSEYPVGSASIEDCRFEGNQAGTMGGALCGITAGFALSRCEFIENTAPEGGAVYSTTHALGAVECTFQANDHDAVVVETDAHLVQFQNCTFHESAGAAVRGNLAILRFYNVIIAFGLDASVVVEGAGAAAEFTCCDLYGNAGGDWVAPFAEQLGVSGNISDDPLFCDREAGDLSLHEDSPCAPFSAPNPECDLIGARPVGCGPSPVVPVTWGRIKAEYR